MCLCALNLKYSFVPIQLPILPGDHLRPMVPADLMLSVIEYFIDLFLVVYRRGTGEDQQKLKLCVCVCSCEREIEHVTSLAFTMEAHGTSVVQS